MLWSQGQSSALELTEREGILSSAIRKGKIKDAVHLKGNQVFSNQLLKVVGGRLVLSRSAYSNLPTRVRAPGEYFSTASRLHVLSNPSSMSFQIDEDVFLLYYRVPNKQIESSGCYVVFVKPDHICDSLCSWDCEQSLRTAKAHHCDNLSELLLFDLCCNG